ncbi:MAG: glycosyl hydrolase family 28 protein [Bacteroidota bacterium]|nr:glycosyl hydrolase family 28 protein [Bacteroidota bacterium]
MKTKKNVTVVLILLTMACVGNELFARNNKKELSIVESGAVGDSVTLNTKTIQDAIDKLYASGGGTLVVPKGIFLTGALYLKQGVDLRIEKDGVLKGSANTADYPPVDKRIEGHTEPKTCPALINAYGIKGLKITGEGTIQGGGKPFWTEFWRRYEADKTTKNLDVYRPQNLFIQDCNHVLVSGLHFRGSGYWNFHMYRCRWVKVENLDIQTPLRSPSTDGIDVDSSQDVDISSCYISVDDDCICMKGSKGMNAMDDKASPPTERVNISNCTFNLGYGVLTLGSEATVVRHIKLENCTVKGPNVNTLLRIKVRTDTPQHYEDIVVNNIKIDGQYNLIDIAHWSQYKDTKGLPEPWHVVKNVALKNISGNIAHFATITPPKCAEVSKVTFENINVKTLSPKYKVIVNNVNGFQMKNCTINDKQAIDIVNRK